MSMAEVFRVHARAVLESIRSGPITEVHPDRTEAIIAEALRQSYESAKGPEGLSLVRLGTLKTVLRLSREKAELNQLVAVTDERRGFERGLVEGYRFVEMTIGKLEKGEL